jgi:chromatin segregation and condensation protein Rec8/ScpA/Scc1 (kleisin family)
MLEVYVPLLHLMFEGKLVLRQEEFFGGILVRACRAAESPPPPRCNQPPGKRDTGHH